MLNRKRPSNHFTPKKGWMNDPNGLLFDGSQYHLFYQHNPFDVRFGNISWGHATSKDLKNWKHQPLAISGSKEKMIYSGTVVKNHLSDLSIQKDSLVAIYTLHDVISEKHYQQSIRYAISTDSGITWDIPNDNLIIERPEKDFRDPKILWYEEEQKWVMVVALPNKYSILFYESFDLLNWNQTGKFSSKTPRGQFWECPDLFQLVDENGNRRWVLTLSGEGYESKGWGMFYFLGEFDGKSFKSETEYQHLDFGYDFYAGITFEGDLDKRIMIGWSGNWAYSNEMNFEEWNGVMSLPRELRIYKNKICSSLLTSQEPIAIFEPAYQNKIEISNGKFSLEIHKSGLAFNREMNPLFQDIPDYIKRFVEDDIHKAEIYFDECILEILVNKGERVLTFQV